MATSTPDKSSSAGSVEEAGAKSVTVDTTDGSSTSSTSDPNVEATDKTAAVVDAERVVSKPAVDPTNPDEVGDAAVQIEDPENRDMSDPQANGNVGYSAEGKVVSNQQGEQANTVQAAPEERQEALDVNAESASKQDPWSDPTVTNQA